MLRPVTQPAKLTRQRNCVGLLHKVCRLEAENEVLRLQIANITADVIVERISKFYQKVAQEGQIQVDPALHAAATSDNAKNRTELPQAKAKETNELKQLTTKAESGSAQSTCACPTIQRFQMRTGAVCLHGSLGSLDTIAENDESDVWHSDAWYCTTTLPLTSAGSSSLAHLEELPRVLLFPQYFLPSCAGRAQHTASEHTATNDVGYDFITYNHSAQWLEFRATMTERIEVRNCIESLCLALQGEVSHPFDSDSPPCSRPATAPIFLRHQVAGHQVAVRSLPTRAVAPLATDASKPRSAMQWLNPSKLDTTAARTHQSFASTFKLSKLGCKG